MGKFTMIEKVVSVSIVLTILAVTGIYAVDYQAKKNDLVQENQLIDQRVTSLREQIQQLLQRKVENVGKFKLLTELELEESTKEIEKEKDN